MTCGLLPAAFLCGALSVAGSCLLTALAWTDEGFVASAQLPAAAHVPVMAILGFVSVFLLAFLARVRPGMPGLSPGRAAS